MPYTIGSNFGDVNSYVPTFYIQPFVPNPSNQQGLREFFHPEYINETEFPEYIDWYIRPIQQYSESQKVNDALEVESSGSSYIHDQLIQKLVIDHGWNLQDFDILKNRAETLMASDGQKCKENTDKEKQSFANFSTINGKGWHLFKILLYTLSEQY